MKGFSLFLVVWTAALGPGGCSHYKEEFSCRTDPGSGNCGRASDIYAKGHVADPGFLNKDVSASAFAGVQPDDMLGKPVVRPPEVWRLWVKPWRDADETLHEASVHYILFHPGTFAYGSRVPDSPGSPGGRARHNRVVTPFTSDLVEGVAPRVRPHRSANTPGRPRPGAPPPNFHDQLRKLDLGTGTAPQQLGTYQRGSGQRGSGRKRDEGRKRD